MRGMPLVMIGSARGLGARRRTRSLSAECSDSGAEQLRAASERRRPDSAHAEREQLCDERAVALLLFRGERAEQIDGLERIGFEVVELVRGARAANQLVTRIADGARVLRERK